MIRALVERLSRGVVLRRRLPARLGGRALYVSPEASLRFWRCGLETADPLLLRLAEELVDAGSCVWDVGANVGLFAFAAAHRTGPRGLVVAIEADPWLGSLMRRTAAAMAADSAPVEVLDVAVSDRAGTATFAIARRGRAANHLQAVVGSSQSGGARSRLQVETRTLDDLLASRRPPDFVKVDVEGAEALCLRGASRLLRDVRPTILCEVSTASVAEVSTLLQGAGYDLFDASLQPADRRPLVQAVWSTLGKPRAAGGAP